MSKTHLSDSDIQQYVLQKAACNVEQIEHIRYCENCKRKVQLYSLLIEGINQQKKPIFDVNLPDLVVRQLLTTKSENSFEKRFIFCISTIAFFLIGVALYVVGSDLISLFSTLLPMLIYLLIITASSLFLFLLIGMYTEYHKKMKALKFN